MSDHSESILPNVLTVTRIVLIPFCVLAYVLSTDTHWIAALLFALASFTDWLDGYLARNWHSTSRFGEFLDPVADKLLIVTTLIVLVGEHSTLWLTVPGLTICIRELVVSALREWMAEINRRADVKVSVIAKVKTAVQMLAILVLLANPPEFDRPWVILGYVLLYFAMVLTLWSMFLLLRAAYPALRVGFFRREKRSSD